jgi:hypothetical protein
MADALVEGGNDASDQGGDAETNFMRASCTLDASVKIYSSRVDSIHKETFKVLGGLSRGGGTNGDKDGDDDDDDNDNDNDGDGKNGEGKDGDGNVKKKKAKKGKKGGRRGINTLETKLSNLNVKKFDLQFEVDPLFQKTSSSVDEGRASGLLLNQLHVYRGCNIAFDSSEVYSMDDPLVPHNVSNTQATMELDFSDLRTTFNKLTNDGDMSTMEICPMMADFRRMKDNLLEGRAMMDGIDGIDHTATNIKRRGQNKNGDSSDDEDENDTEKDDGRYTLESLSVATAKPQSAADIAKAAELQRAIEREEKLFQLQQAQAAQETATANQHAHSSSTASGQLDLVNESVILAAPISTVHNMSGVSGDDMMVDDGGVGFFDDIEMPAVPTHEQVYLAATAGGVLAQKPKSTTPIATITSSSSVAASIGIDGEVDEVDAELAAEAQGLQNDHMTAMLSAHLGWAGPSHWKFVPVAKKTTTSTPSTSANGEEKKTRKKKAPFVIDFENSEPVEESAWDEPARGTNQLSKAAMTKVNSISLTLLILISIDGTLIHYIPGMVCMYVGRKC